MKVSPLNGLASRLETSGAVNNDNTPHAILCVIRCASSFKRLRTSSQARCIDCEALLCVYRRIVLHELGIARQCAVKADRTLLFTVVDAAVPLELVPTLSAKPSGSGALGGSPISSITAVVRLTASAKEVPVDLTRGEWPCSPSWHPSP